MTKIRTKQDLTFRRVPTGELTTIPTGKYRVQEVFKDGDVEIIYNDRPYILSPGDFANVIPTGDK